MKKWNRSGVFMHVFEEGKSAFPSLPAKQKAKAFSPPTSQTVSITIQAWKNVRHMKRDGRPP